MKISFHKLFILIAFALLFISALYAVSEDKYVSKAVVTEESSRCLNCHATRQPKLVEAWEKTVHAEKEVGCYECHKGEPTDPGAIPGHFGFCVSLAVSPKTCGECHKEQYASFASSSHALAFDTIKNIPIRKFSEITFETSCASCHGNELTLKRGKAIDIKWPNHGIGRINTDGSRGNCSACHGFHEDSLERVRKADTCARCHNTEIAPAMESWKTSRHGAGWEVSNKGANLNKTNFVPQNEPLMRPDCYTCHIAPTKENDKATHNPSERLSWKLAGLKAKHTDNWGEKRLKMEETCRNCHAGSQIEQFYRRFDSLVVQINDIIDSKNIASLTFKTISQIKGNAMKARTGAAMQSPKEIVSAMEELLDN